MYFSATGEVAFTARLPWSILLRWSDAKVCALEVALEFALLLFFREVRALIVELLASAEADFDLHEGAAEVDAERDEGVAVLLQLAEDFIDLGLMEEELAVAQRVLVKDVALLVRIHMHAVDEDLSVFYVAEGFLDGALAEAEGLDLCARELDAALEGLIHEVVVVGLLVVCDELGSFFFSVICHGNTSMFY